MFIEWSAYVKASPWAFELLDMQILVLYDHGEWGVRKRQPSFREVCGS